LSGHEPTVPSSPVTRLDGGALFRAHARFVAGFLIRLGVDRRDIDDAVQEVFLIAHRRGGFEVGAAQPTTWLAEIALRVASGLRRTRRRHPEDGAADPETPSEAPTPFEAAAAAQELDRVQRALETLSLDHRAVFVLYEIEGEPCEAIAAGLGVPVGTVYSRLHAARRGFQKAYAELGERDPAPLGRRPREVA
jgi:RNA polymerase sigma-70 factor (ECF subfamily)